METEAEICGSLINKTYKVIIEEGVVSFLKKASRYALRRLVNIPSVGRFFCRIAGYVLKKRAERCRSLKELVDLAFNFKFLGVNINLRKSERRLLAFCKFSRKLDLEPYLR